MLNSGTPVPCLFYILYSQYTYCLCCAGSAVLNAILTSLKDLKQEINTYYEHRKCQ